MRILFLSGWFPEPPDNGIKRRIHNQLRLLGRRHRVTLVSFSDGEPTLAQRQRLTTFCAEVHAVPVKAFDPHRWSARLASLGWRPRSLVDTFSPAMAEVIRDLVSAGGYDVVVTSEIPLSNYARYFDGIPALLDTVELGILYDQFARASTAWARWRYWLTWEKWRLYLRHVLGAFRVCTVVSQRERELLELAAPGGPTIEVVPNCLDLAEYDLATGSREPNSLIFTGAFSYAVNYEAMSWFVRDIYPLIQANVPEVSLTITGDPAGRALPATRNLRLAGHVADIRPLVAASEVSLAPLRTGAGSRVKILEAMALGTPVVSTSKGAEGLDVRPGEHLLIADEPRMYAEEVVRLLGDRVLRDRLARNARRLVEERYDWARVGPRFEEMVFRVAAARRGEGPR